MQKESRSGERPCSIAQGRARLKVVKWKAAGSFPAGVQNVGRAGGIETLHCVDSRAVHLHALLCSPVCSCV